MNKKDFEPRTKLLEEAILWSLDEYDHHCKGASKIKHHDYMAVINFREPSFRKRFYVYDLKRHEVVRTHHCSHGINSSDINRRAYAVRFSNIVNSRRSSLGAMVTAETYYGKHGYSLRLDGLEKDINDNVRKRYIVIHPADYVTDSFILGAKRAGQSWGCPALDPAVSRDVIDMIKDGRFLYAYY